MGMFDAPRYLTGKNGYVEEGDKFWIHNAKVDGVTNVNGKEREQVKLSVSKEKDGEREIVYTSGAGIVGQVRRMDENDRKNLPMEVRLDTVPSKQGQPTNVLTPSSQAPPDRPEPDDDAF
jgi:hypothetical protein